MEQINTYINDLGKRDPTLNASVTIIDGKDPMEISPKDPVFDVIQGASQKAIGKKLELGRTGSAGGDLYFLFTLAQGIWAALILPMNVSRSGTSWTQLSVTLPSS
jgi:hypothetical protein